MKGKYKEMRKKLTYIDGNDKMKTNTTTINSAIDRYVSMKKQGKRSKMKHMSKEAFRKITYKQDICGGFINIRERITIMKFTKRH